MRITFSTRNTHTGFLPGCVPKMYGSSGTATSISSANAIAAAP